MKQRNQPERSLIRNCHGVGNCTSKSTHPEHRLSSMIILIMITLTVIHSNSSNANLPAEWDVIVAEAVEQDAQTDDHDRPGLSS